MKHIKINFVIIAACLLIVLFVYAALIKLADYKTFSVQLGQSPMLTQTASLLVWIVPITELVLAGLLSFEGTRLAGLFGSLGLMTAFSVYIIIVSQYSYYVPCSCGGVIEDLSWTGHLLMNTCFVILSMIAIFSYPVNKKDHYVFPNASG